jgi:hypothetical protein
VQRALRMVFVGAGCTEQRDDPVACRLLHIAAVSLDRHHKIQTWIDDGSTLPDPGLRSDPWIPMISANSMVTVLRSPSRFSVAVVSPIRIGPWVDFLTDASPDGATEVPHFLQNRAPRLTAVLHAGQTSSSFDPHCSQNAASGGLSVLQEEHCMGLGA